MSSGEFGSIPSKLSAASSMSSLRRNYFKGLGFFGIFYGGFLKVFTGL